MCCLFGIHDYGHSLTRKQKNQLVSILGAASEERGTDATGIAYNFGGRMRIYKRPWPAHWMFFQVPVDTSIVMGHTRMTTQGNERKNCNNHPFPGSVGDRRFALAHNGVLYNDGKLRRQYLLPATEVDTDSYVAVQLIERTGELSFESLAYMAEKLEGTFTFTVLSDANELYFVKGNNPLCILHFPERGLYVYASTPEILHNALKRLPFDLGVPERAAIKSGEIPRLDANGHQTRSTFDDSAIRRCSHPYAMGWYDLEPEEEYLSDLKSIAALSGLYPEDIDALIEDGMDLMEIEEMIYCG